MEGGHDLLCVHVVMVAVLAHVGVLRLGVAVDDVLGYHAALPAAAGGQQHERCSRRLDGSGAQRKDAGAALDGMVAHDGYVANRLQEGSSSQKHAAALGPVLLCCCHALLAHAHQKVSNV